MNSNTGRTSNGPAHRRKGLIMVGTSARVFALTVVLCEIAFGQQPNGANPQGNANQGPQTEIRTATIKSTEMKGRLRKLVVAEESGTEHAISLTPQIRFEVRGTGNTDFFRPGQMAYAQGTLTNKRLFVTEVTVQVLPKGRKAVPGRMEKAPRVVGQSTETYRISGPIIEFGNDPDYPDRQGIALRTAGPGAPLILEPNFKVHVVSDNFEACKEGLPVELEGVTDLRLGRFLIGRVTVLLPDELKADEVLGPVEEPKKKN